MDISALQSVYFVGAGGIGMSALARFFLFKGKYVAGYDRTPSELTEKLIAEGADIHYAEDVRLIPEKCLNKDATLVIYTPAVPATHRELEYFVANGFQVCKRSQVLGLITRSGKALATDPDHLDVYGTKEAYLESFAKYTSLICPGGCLILHKNLELVPRVCEGVRVYSYSRDEGDFHASRVRVGNGKIVMDFVAPSTVIPDVELGVPVLVNIENSVAAMALAWLNGVSEEEIRRGMASFRGVERRFDFKIKSDNLVLLSDYAHHPEEIRQSVISVRELYKGKKITAVFQPHLYTRTRDFYREFAQSLSLLDEVILLDIYPAREKPIPGVTSRLIYDCLRTGIRKIMCSREKLLDVLDSESIEVLIVLGAGDVDNDVPAIQALLESKNK